MEINNPKRANFTGRGRWLKNLPIYVAHTTASAAPASFLICGNIQHCNQEPKTQFQIVKVLLGKSSLFRKRGEA
jgi:hypothetical protein